MTLEYTVGCDEDGRLTAVRARIVGDTGAYASVGDKVLERAAGHSCSVYRVPNVDVEARAVYTNNPPAGAMRGFGSNQANFAIEGMMDILAERVGVDGWEMRWRNAVDVGEIGVVVMDCRNKGKTARLFPRAQPFLKPPHCVTGFAT